MLEALGSGCVITGGGANLPGLLDVTESQLRVPARIGIPVRLSNMPVELVSPDFSTVIGMLLYAHRTRVTRAAENNSPARQTARHLCCKLVDTRRKSGGP